MDEQQVKSLLAADVPDDELDITANQLLRETLRWKTAKETAIGMTYQYRLALLAVNLPVDSILEDLLLRTVMTAFLLGLRAGKE